VLLIAFAGTLIAVVLRALAGRLQRWAPVTAKHSYAIVVWSIVIIVAALVYGLGPSVIDQAHDMFKAIPGSIDNLRSSLDQHQWGRDLTHLVETSMQSERASGLAKVVATASVNAVTDAVVILAIALFLGSNPSLYRRGLLYLVPARHRAKAAEVLDTVGTSMSHWLLGQLVPMIFLGVGTMIALWIMGLPLAFTLGLFTGAMLFIPYVGSVLAYIPTALIAFTKGPRDLIYVTIVYVGVHVAEGYVITPIAQRHAVRLPPALTLLSQFFMWTVAGILGVVVATPLAAAILAAVQKLYAKPKQEVAATEPVSSSPS